MRTFNMFPFPPIPLQCHAMVEMEAWWWWTSHSALLSYTDYWCPQFGAHHLCDQSQKKKLLQTGPVPTLSRKNDMCHETRIATRIRRIAITAGTENTSSRLPHPRQTILRRPGSCAKSPSLRNAPERGSRWHVRSG